MRLSATIPVMTVVVALGCGEGDGRRRPVCVPDCAGRACGGDGCGGSCGQCEGGAVCQQDGQCLCVPETGTTCCGRDVCLVDSCGATGALFATCVEGCVDARCLNCAASCDGRECGPDGCGGFCGKCPQGVACLQGRCDCVPGASHGCCGKDVCSFDSCGREEGVIEACEVGCRFGACSDCAPSCAGRECGVDGCGNSCGSCSGGRQCVDGECECVPDAERFCCGNAVCSRDSCGELGPQTPCPEGCEGGECRCEPDCAGRECGPDGCDGQCGQCGDGEVCEDGQCVVESCGQVPACVSTCQVVADCGVPGAAPGGVWDSDNFTCASGRCLYRGCRTDEECEDEPSYPSQDLTCRTVACGFKTCTAACSKASDCVGKVAPKGPLAGEANFICDDGWCRYAGCQSDAECEEAMASLPAPRGYRCRQVAGAGTCVRGCVNVNDCVIQPASVLADADNYACENGACRYRGCQSTAECAAAFAGTPGTYECAPGYLAPGG